MSTAIDRLIPELTALSAAERAQLAHYLISTLEPDEDLDAESAWEQELTRRADEIRSGSVQGRSAEDVFDSIEESQT